MRRAEILNLKWEEIDFKSNFIRLGGDRTKNKKVRSIPLNPKVAAYLKKLRRPIKGGFIFSSRRWRRKSYVKAVKAAELGNFTFHDLRHCAINNLRLAGNDQYMIKQASGHKTDIAFSRYNLVTEDELMGMKNDHYHRLLKIKPYEYDHDFQTKLIELYCFLSFSF